VCAHIEDIIVFTPNQESPLEVLKQLFDQLRKFILKISQEKCQFMLDEVKYLGYTVNAEGIFISSDRICHSLDFSPGHTSEVRSFLGLLQMLRRFIPNLSEACHGLTQVSSKDFSWSLEQETSWNATMVSLDQPLKNNYLDTNKELVLYKDASDHVLEQY
jgi:hypothetical protein